MYNIPESALREYAQQGLSIGEVADIYGCATSVILKRLKKYNIKLVRKNAIKDYAEKAQFCKTHTMSEILKKYGSYGKWFCRRYDVKPLKIEHHNDVYLGIVTDLRNGMKQCDVRRKYNVTRQYVSYIFKKEKFYEKLR